MSGPRDHPPAAGQAWPAAAPTATSSRTRPAQLLGLAAWLGLCFAAAGVGGLASARAAGFYEALVQPAWAPPAGWFAPVWSVLYLAMAVAAWRVWRAGVERHDVRLGLALFLAQLAVNALWTWLFFAWRLGAWAFADVLVLGLLILWTTAVFRRVDRWAVLLMLPYLAWVVFASALTFAVWQLNPGALG